MNNTPGPWSALGEYVYADGVDPIAEVKRYPRYENARLIAAAPEMLEALERGLKLIEAMYDGSSYSLFRQHTEEIQEMEAAIAKAKGE